MDLRKKKLKPATGTSARYGSVTDLQPERPLNRDSKTKQKKILAVASVIILTVALVSGGVYYKNIASTRDLAAQVTPPIPGASALQSGYNMLNGKYMSLVDSKNIGTFQYPSSPTSAEVIQLGSTVYVIPKGVRITVTASCSTQQKSAGVLRTSSFSELITTADSNSYGYDATTTIEASVPVGDASIGASRDIRNALMFGNSDSMTESRSQSSANFNYEESMEVQAEMFVAQITWSENDMTFDPAFITAFNNVYQSADTPAQSRVRVYQFFNTYGSHVVQSATLGARCLQRVFMNAGETTNSYANAQTTSSNHDAEFFGFKFGSSSTSTVSTQQDYGTAVSYQMMNMQCDGSVADNRCDPTYQTNSMHPVPMSVQPLPIWQLNGPSFTAQAKQVMQSAVDYLVKQAKICSDAQCNQSGGSGVCILKKDFFSISVMAANFDGNIGTSYFETNCACVDGGSPNCAPIPLMDMTVYAQPSNGQFCPDVCKQHGQTAIETGSYTPAGVTYYFCDADMGDGFRGGFNDFRTGNKDRCYIAVGSGQKKASYRCYCTATTPTNIISFQPTTGTNCDIVCNNANMDPVMTGPKQNGVDGVFYACAADAASSGYRGGWNAERAIPGKCVAMYGGEHRYGKFNCMCKKR